MRQIITKTCLFKYIENVLKTENFPIKKLWYFFIFLLKTDCGYSLEVAEPPRQGGSNEYPQAMF